MLITHSNFLDIDTIDNNLGDGVRSLANTLAQIIGSVVLISIVLPWFLVAMAIISVAYWYMALFYRTSARELKRLGEPTRSFKQHPKLNTFSDAILRSSLYSHFSESLAGLGTIRAYDETERFLNENIHRMDIENRYDGFAHSPSSLGSPTLAVLTGSRLQTNAGLGSDSTLSVSY